jgi:hypothetical protein
MFRGPTEKDLSVALLGANATGSATRGQPHKWSQRLVYVLSKVSRAVPLFYLADAVGHGRPTLYLVAEADYPRISARNVFVSENGEIKIV